MNAERRKKLDDILSRLEQIRADIKIVKDEEQEAYDNLPESFQNGEKGEAMQSAISSLEDADNDVDSIISNIENAKGE